jgi:hypothetical protein
MSKPQMAVGKPQVAVGTPYRSMRLSEYDAKAAVKAAKRRERHIEILEKYYRKYERKIKRNERELKKPYVLETPGFEGREIPEDLSKLWMRDIISISVRDNIRRTLGAHKERLEQLLSDIENLKAGLPEDEISPIARATIYKKWNLGVAGVKELLQQGHGLWY